MRKRLLAAGLAVMMIFGMLAMVASATSEETYYHMSVNDQLPAASLDVTPIEVSGTIYVPYTIFDQRVSGVDIGVYSSLLRTGSSYTVTVYDEDAMLTFNLLNNTTTDRNGFGVTITAIIRNNQVYVPVRGICEYFGLTYSLYATSYGNLVRITNGNEYLVGDKFLTSASYQMNIRYTEYLQSLVVDTPASTPTPTPTTTTDTSTDASTPPLETVEDVEILVGILCEGDGSIQDILDTLEDMDCGGMFFFYPEDIAQCADDIIRIVGSGHMVGLALKSTQGEDAQEEIAQGLEGFRTVAQVVPHTLLSQGESWESELEGWTLWHTEVDGTAQEDSAITLAVRIKSLLAEQMGTATLLLSDDTNGATAFNSISSTLQSDPYQVKFPSEYAISRS